MLIKLEQELTHGENLFPAGSVVHIVIEDGYYNIKEVDCSRGYLDMEFGNLPED